ncbi:hypothetical protein D3C86_2252070 [compost metagenome]
MRIDVGIETVFAGVGVFPRRFRLFLDKRNTDDGFDALEAVFPGNDEANGRAILVRQGFAV